ncbi:MAG: DUF4233 domain-containing protein [Actinobacteria bacterium]|nr:DUF4233 domain-containing protein [Actinomycetota bacterium]
MKVLGSAVLTMEAFVMGFAILFASKSHSGVSLIIGGVIALLLLTAVGFLRSRAGWILGSILQIPLIGYGIVATTLYFLGTLFAGLWVTAIVIGRKGEAARAAFLSQEKPK